MQTQTPIISRTIKNERQGRKIFYGMMIAEGVIAMIWAAAAMSLFNGYYGLNEIIAAGGPGAIVSESSTTLLLSHRWNIGCSWCCCITDYFW